LIAAENLTKFYGAVAALRQVSFEIDKGEIVGFLGPNGAGKTTTLRILTCYMPPTSGRATVAGLDCEEHPLEVRAMVGYLPENVPLYSDMTVRRFLAFAAAAKGVRRQHCRQELHRVIDACGLQAVADRIIGHLSKGYRQRTGIAQALLNDPAILILDEPTLGLDPGQIVEIRALIRELGKERTIILSSHILPEVSQLCDRIIIINKGQIVATDTPENLTAQLQQNARVLLEVEGPSEEVIAVLMKIPGVHKVIPGEHRSKYVVENARELDLRPEIARAIVQSGWQLRQLTAQDMSLEEIFMHLVTDEDMAEAV